MKEVIILTQFAEDMIKQNNFLKAKQALLKALSFDPHSEKIYLLLGNTFYLLGKKDSSFKAYLAYCHLHIRKFTLLDARTLETIIDAKYNKLPDELKETIPCKAGVIVYDNNMLASHLAHCFIDLGNEVSDPILEECIDLYKNSLITGVHVQELINFSNICYDDYVAFTNSHYISLGRELIIENLKWDSIDSEEVKTLYFSNPKAV